MYMEFRPSGVVVKCKLGCPKVLVEHGHKTSEYAELTMIMQEVGRTQGQHITAVCRDHFAEPQPLGAIYAEDIEQWIANAVRAGTSLATATTMGESLARRTPIGVAV